MKKYEFIYDNEVIEKINNRFWWEFDYLYRSINIKGKGCVFKYISSFFRKWFYSALIDGTVITPSGICEYCSGEKNVYPIIKSNSINRIGSIEFENIRFSLDNHPLCQDFRTVIQGFSAGISLDIHLGMDFGDIKKLGYLSSNDSDYVTYLVMLGMDMGYIEKMPSVGVEMYCTSKKIKELDLISNRELIKLLFDKAVKIASSFLSDDFMGEEYNVSDEIIKDWLINYETVDSIFSSVYGEFSLDGFDVEDLVDIGGMETAVAAKAYLRGINIDKWFLTPFSYYFRFIDTTYMYEFSCYDEILYLLSAVNANSSFEDIGEFEEEIIDAAVYSPCTMYKLSRLGAEFFNMEYNSKEPEVFECIGKENVIDAALWQNRECINKILEFYKAEFKVLNLNLELVGGENNRCSIQVRENTTLDRLHQIVCSLFNSGMIICDGYRFYKIPESPFTEYTPGFMETRGPNTEDSTVCDIIEIGEVCYYEVVIYRDKAKKYTLSIELESISESVPGVEYPVIVNHNIFNI